MAIAYIGIGSNDGDRSYNIERAISMIEDIPHTILLKRSQIYETKPVDMPENTPWFLNLVIEIDTLLFPEQLHKNLKDIEKRCGKNIRETRNDLLTDRPIDLDILLFDDLIIAKSDLIIPHPLFHKRNFVLRPLKELSPFKIHPQINKTITELEASISEDQIIRLYVPARNIVSMGETIAINTFEKDDIVVVDLNGTVNEKASREIKRKFNEVLSEGTGKYIIINFDGVDYIDSAGIGLLVNVKQQIRDKRGKLVLVGLTGSVKQVFDIVHLGKVFDTYDTVEEAVFALDRRQILLYEKREDIGLFYREILRVNNYNVRIVNSLERVFSVAGSERTDLLLIDALANEEDKYLLVRKFKTNDNLRKIPILVVSIYDEERFLYGQLGVNHFIMKPFPLEKFLLVIKELVSGVEENV